MPDFTLRNEGLNYSGLACVDMSSLTWLESLCGKFTIACLRLGSLFSFYLG